MRIKDRTFIISGASSGLGLATARDLQTSGGYIAILDLNQGAGEEAVQQLGRDRAAFFEVDVTETEAIEAAVEGVVKWVKETGKEIGGVIAAAGVGNPGKMIDRHNNPLPISQIDFVLNINIRGTLDLIRLCLPHMTQVKPIGEDGEKGVIIMLSSSAAYDGQPGQVAYAASKGAVRSVTLPLARDLAPLGIRVVTIAPSMFESNMTARLSQKVKESLQRTMEFPKRPGQGPEFAHLVRHAIENIMLNGEVIRLDGAMRMPSRL